MRRAGTAALVALNGLCAACVIFGGGTHDLNQSGFSPDYEVNFYEPFDNSRDWGPGYLRGPPRASPRFDHDQSARIAPPDMAHLPSSPPLPSIPTDSAPNASQPSLPTSPLPTSPLP
jgi:hypothetical protein